MRTLDYALREGWRSLWRSRGSSALAVMAITLALLILGGLLVVTTNLQSLVTTWTRAAEFSVFLRADATSEQRGAIETMIEQSGVAMGRTYVSKEEAFKRFREQFADLAPLTSEFTDNPFPASIEVRLVPGAEDDGRTENLVRGVASLPGVDDVRYDREWLTRLATALRVVRGVGWTVGVLMSIAAAATVASVVRLGLHSRRDELEIMQLVGSPLVFIRGPFVAEGVIQGGVGALLAIASLWLGLFGVNSVWGMNIQAVLDGASIRFLPFAICVYLFLGGMVVGALGGFAASRHAV